MPTTAPVNLSIGEPKHATPAFITQALTDNLAGLANYPTTQGSEALRQSIADWITRRYKVPALDITKQILPVNGSREALFAFAQAVIDTNRTQPVVISPNPFYQIYEGAAYLAGATPYYLNTLPENGYSMEFDRRTGRHLAAYPAGLCLLSRQSHRQGHGSGGVGTPVRAFRSLPFRDRLR